MMTPILRLTGRAAFLLLVCCLTTTSFAQILSVSPAQNALQVPANTNIVVTFNQDMATATIRDTTFLAWGMQSGWHPGTIVYNADLRRATLTPAKPFAPGEIVSVTLTNDITTSAQQPLQKFEWHFTIAVTPSSGKFPAKSDYGTGAAPVYVAAADLDGDMDVDFITANRDGKTVSILKNLGNGKFQAKQDYPAGNLPTSVFAADFDHDQDVDLAVLTKSAAGKDVVAILKNNSAGTLLPRVEYETGANAQALFAADFDADGDLDLATASSSGAVFILKNKGSATFQAAVSYSAGGNAVALFATDLDDDGDVDVAVANNSGSKISVLKNDGNGVFQPKTEYNVPGAPTALFAADFDNDGDLDLAAAMPASNKVAILNNKNDGTFPTRTDFDTAAGLVNIFAADLDGDGDVDLAATTANQTLAVMQNNPASGTALQAPAYYQGGAALANIIAAEVDGDGDMELLSSDITNHKVLFFSNRNLLYTSAAELRFNRIYVGFDKELSFKLYNDGSNSTNITSVSTTNAKFSVTSANTFTLAGGDSASVTVRYAPAAVTNDTGTVTIASNSFAPLRLPVSGTGLPPGPVINVTPATLSFGNTSVNKTGDLLLTISNTGVLDLNISNITLGNPNFAWVGGAASLLPPNAYKMIAVRFTPPFLGAQVDTLKIFNNDASAGNLVRLPLSGSGASNALPEISVQPFDLKYDSVLVKLTKNLPLRVYNRGAAVLNVSNVVSNSTRFDVLSPANFNLAPGDSADLTIRFSPTQTGLSNATLTLTSNDANENPLTIKLSGIGKAIPAPALAKIFPAAGQRLQTLDVGFKGANFIAGLTSVNLGPNITVNKITVQRPDSLTANVTIAVNAATGGREAFVVNSSPGGGVSAMQTFTVNNPAPVLTKINPATGTRLQKLNVGFKGANFISGVTAVNAGANITVNSISVQRADSLTVSVTIAEQATLGPRDFSVVNSAPGGGISSPQVFTLTNPVPELASITPTKGERHETLNVAFKGTNFIAGVTTVNAGAGISVNSLTVTSATNLTANVTITSAAATGSRDFSVSNAAPGGGVSAGQAFLVNNPAPTLASISPNGGNLLQTLNIGFKGTNFISGVSQVNAGPGITVNSVTVQRPDSLTANVTIGANALAGLRNFSVTNSAPGGGISGNRPFVINKPTPTLASLMPAQGGRLQTLDVGFTGTNFIDGITRVNIGPNIIINNVTVHRADSLTANITINFNATPGPRNVTVSNGDDAVSESRVFTIIQPPPILTRLTPSSANRLQTLRVGFKGDNFIAGISTVEVGPNITVNNLTVYRLDTLTASLTIAAEAAAGPCNFFVSNNGGGTSAAQVFIVNNPAPELNSLKPASGARGQTVTVGFKGANFFSGATSIAVGAGLTVNNVTVNRVDSLTATLTIAANAEVGPRQFSVTNALPGGGTSANVIFTVTHPAPALTRINPASGNRLQTLNIGCKGTNFFAGSSSLNAGPNITVNSVTVHRRDSLTANITIGADAALGSRDFAVSNGEGVISENRIFAVNNPAPVLAGLEPARAYRRQRLDVVFTGANFIQDNTVVNAGPGIVVNSIVVNSPARLTANLTITASVQRAPRFFSVTNLAPGGGTSADQLFFIANNEPTQPQLLSPAKNQIIQLSKLAPPIKFVWSESFDGDFDDTVKYALHLKGPGLDTTFAAVQDTSVTLNIMPLLKLNSEYTWDLRVSDGVVTITWPDRATFRTSSTITSVQEDGHLLPLEYRLEQNYPNPFALAAKYAETTINYQLPKSSLVTLKIFDVLGREMITLVQAQQPPGYYHVSWNGKNSTGQFVPGGVYLCRLQAGNFARVMKMMVVR